MLLDSPETPARPVEFRPNLSPKQVIRMGSFGGTYFRPIKSSVTGKSYRDQWKEFPAGEKNRLYLCTRDQLVCNAGVTNVCGSRPEHS